MNIRELLKVWLIEHSEIELAILFGSNAVGTATELSDVDLAIQLSSGQALQAEDKINYLDELSQLFNKSIDLVDLRAIGQPLLSQVVIHGECLVGESLFSQLAIRNVNSSQDFMPSIERMLTTRRDRWLANG